MTESKAVELLKNNEERRTAGTYIVVKHLSIIALEKQIPKKPKERDCIGFDTLVCPVCKGALYLYEPYCDNCGQAIDWSDEE